MESHHANGHRAVCRFRERARQGCPGTGPLDGKVVSRRLHLRARRCGAYWAGSTAERFLAAGGGGFVRRRFLGPDRVYAADVHGGPDRLCRGHISPGGAADRLARPDTPGACHRRKLRSVPLHVSLRTELGTQHRLRRTPGQGHRAPQGPARRLPCARRRSVYGPGRRLGTWPVFLCRPAPGHGRLPSAGTAANHWSPRLRQDHLHLAVDADLRSFDRTDYGDRPLLCSPRQCHPNSRGSGH